MSCRLPVHSCTTSDTRGLEAASPPVPPRDEIVRRPASSFRSRAKPRGVTSKHALDSKRSCGGVGGRRVTGHKGKPADLKTRSRDKKCHDVVTAAATKYCYGCTVEIYPHSLSLESRLPTKSRYYVVCFIRITATVHT